MVNDDIEDDFSSIGIPRSAAGGIATSARATNGANGPRATANPDRGSNGEVRKSGVVQPKPQALPKRTGPSSIIVSPRQKGNPILNNIKSMPWEYGDIPADYLLGLTSCALFLSLKYHRLHPEYIYNRIKALQGKYALRVVLVMVDITNHEDPIKELSKTSLINNVTLVLCWSAAEGGRYLELFKTYENAAPTSIKQHQSTSYSDRLVDFVTTPRSINKTDAVALVSQFGTIRTAVNARHEDVANIAGWGEKKVQRWCAAVREPFRAKKATKRGLARDDTLASLRQPVSRAGTLSRDVTRGEADSPARGLFLEDSIVEDEEQAAQPIKPHGAQLASIGTSDADQRSNTRVAEDVDLDENAFNTNGGALAAAMTATASSGTSDPPQPEVTRKRKPEDDDLNDGVMAALSKLRKS